MAENRRQETAALEWCAQDFVSVGIKADVVQTHEVGERSTDTMGDSAAADVAVVVVVGAEVDAAARAILAVAQPAAATIDAVLGALELAEAESLVLVVVAVEHLAV